MKTLHQYQRRRSARGFSPSLFASSSARSAARTGTRLASGSGRGRRRPARRATSSSTGPAAARRRVRYAGSFRTKRLATLRAGWVEGELAAGRVPDLRARRARRADGADASPQAAARWHASRVDVAEATRVQHRTALNRVLPILGDRRVDELEPADVADLVAALARRRARRASRSARRVTALAMVLDHAGVDPNPARDRCGQAAARGARGAEPADRRARRGRLPAAPVEAPAAAAVPRLVGRPRLARSTSRSSATTTSRGAASGCAPRRRRRGGRSGSSCTRRSPTRSRRRSARARTATPTRACSPAPAPTRSARRSRRRARRPACRCSRRTTCATGASRCCTCAACRGRGSASSSGSATSPSPRTPTPTCSLDETRARLRGAARLDRAMTFHWADDEAGYFRANVWLWRALLEEMERQGMLKDCERTGDATRTPARAASRSTSSARTTAGS